jgi:hypothetical protein
MTTCGAEYKSIESMKTMHESLNNIDLLHPQDDISPSSKAEISRPMNLGLSLNRGIIMWMEMLSCIYSSRTPEFSICHRHLLDGPHPQINMDEIIGCRSSVVAQVLDIILLSRWKREAESAGTLSFRELALRAQAIETGLEEITQSLGRKNVSAHSSSGSVVEDEIFPQSSGSNSTADGIITMSAADRTTHIFACTALIYLHTVTSGSNLGAIDVRKAVERVIRGLQLLVNSDHLISAPSLHGLLWPLFMVGCLAARSQQATVRTLLLAAMQDGNKEQRNIVDRVLSTLEQCWTAFRKPPGPSSDSAAGNSVGKLHWDTLLKSIPCVPLLM